MNSKAILLAALGSAVTASGAGANQSLEFQEILQNYQHPINVVSVASGDSTQEKYLGLNERQRALYDDYFSERPSGDHIATSCGSWRCAGHGVGGNH